MQKHADKFPKSFHYNTHDCIMFKEPFIIKVLLFCQYQCKICGALFALELEDLDFTFDRVPEYMKKQLDKTCNETIMENVLK